MRRILILLIQAYRLLAGPFLGNHCRFYPSCSHYAQIAIERHGAVKGAGMALFRIARCHPWHAGGHDPVPRKADS